MTQEAKALFERHRQMLDDALAASARRDYWSAFPEVPSGKIYGETAKADGEAAFAARLGKSFDLPGHPRDAGEAGAEVSPYGGELGVRYPRASVEALIEAASRAAPALAAAGIEARVGACLEILARLNKASFEMANAVMRTTGQGFAMAFQAGGPHAQDRGLEAVTYAYAEMTRTPARATWSKQEGKGDPIVLEKEWRIVPRGLALTIGCNTFPTWNGYPGLFASLATGNPVIVKPHPSAILPLAITVAIARDVLSEAGLPADAVLLAVDEPGAEVTRDLAVRPEIAMIDYTGSSTFGSWLRQNARQAAIYSEEAGINPVVIAGAPRFSGMCRNLAFSLSLYSGQMCTAPQNVFVPAGGIDTDQGHKSFDEVAAGIATAVDELLSDPARAMAVCGAIAADATIERVRAAESLGRVVRASAPIEGAGDVRTATPLILAVEASAEDAYSEERFGPIAFVVACKDADDALARAADSARSRGAITAAVYASDEDFLARAADAFAAAGANLSCNLTGGIYVNQSAAFSDYHATGANPAANASLTDTAFVAGRFRIVAVRRPQAA